MLHAAGLKRAVGHVAIGLDRKRDARGRDWDHAGAYLALALASSVQQYEIVRYLHAFFIN